MQASAGHAFVIRHSSFVNVVSVVMLAVSVAGLAVGQEPALTPEQKQRQEQLNAIGYLQAENPATASKNVTFYRKGQTCDGPNLYVSGHACEATLIDMEGRMLHKWTRSYTDVWPGRPVPDQGYGHLSWRRAHVFENGDLLAIFEGVGLIKLDKDSKVLWVYDGRAHHDLKVMDNGDIYVLTRVAHMVPRIHATNPILEDFIAILDKDGHEKSTLSLLEAAERSEFWPVVRGLMPKDGDIFHANTLQWLDGSKESVSPLFKKGRILTSFKTFGAVAIVHMDEGKLVWLKVGPWVGQHEPVLLGNGNMMLFDNNRFCDYSRVVEFEPFTDHIVWYYLGNPPNSFFTKACGCCQPLPNGNVLITESEHGHAFEVTRAKTVVWEFFNPNTVVIKGEKMVGYLYDCVRLRPDFPLGWTQARQAPPPNAAK